MDISELLLMLQNGGTIALYLAALVALLFILCFGPLVWIVVLKSDHPAKSLVKVIEAWRKPKKVKKIE